ncbi:MAG: choice-of-anchor tandem repeat GloVer-containing protein [Candidatus Staskawiczbacteria bacterium]
MASATSTVMLHEFAGGVADGKTPQGSLVLSGSTLYGMTTNGGNDDAGTIFSVDPDDLTTYTILHEFAGGVNDGAWPYYGSSLLVSGTTLYGMTLLGGDNSAGTIFSMGVDGSAFTLIHEFAGGINDGSYPFGALVLSGSTLYGMAKNGGSLADVGVIFSVGVDGSNFTLLHRFAGGVADGSDPYSSLILSGSTLYGMTNTGGDANVGTIFSIGTNGLNFTLLHEFAGQPNDGASPSYDSLVLSGSTLYGMTKSGGDSNVGTIFSVGVDGSGFTVLYDFINAAGNNPLGSLIIFDSIFYGMTSTGGSSLVGDIFSVGVDGSGFTVLHNFAGGVDDGANPYGSLVLSGSTLYGLTSIGGNANVGTIFSYSLLADTTPRPVASPSTVSVTEGASDSFSISLSTEPTANVVISLAVTAPGYGSSISISPSTLTFTADNWSIGQTVTVSALNDSAYSGNRIAQITESITSTDTDYNNYDASPVSVGITEDETWPSSVVGCSPLNSSDLCEEMTYEVENRLTSLTPSDSTQDIWATRGNGASGWSRNSSFWGADLDFTGVSPWNSNGYYRAGTLITPLHVLVANHYPINNNSTVIFVTADNTIVSRTVSDQMQIGDSDIQLLVLNAAVPATIAYYPIMSYEQFKDYSSSLRVPLVLFNQLDSPILKDMVGFGLGTITDASIIHETPSPTDSERYAFRGDIIAGDSGDAGFFVVNDQPVLVLTNQTVVSGPFIGRYIDEINDAIVTLGDGGGYQVTALDLSAFVPNSVPAVTAATLSITTGSVAGTAVGTVSATDSHGGDSLSYAFVSGNTGSAFAINSSTGAITVNDPSAFDSQINSQFTLVVSATDDWPYPGTGTGSITVNVLPNVPSSLTLVADSASQITASWSANSNPVGTQYYIENTTASTNSGWTTDTSWASSDLTCSKSYSFKVKARNGDGLSTSYTDISAATTLSCGGGGLPAGALQPPIIPQGGFSVSINSNASTTNSRIVTLALAAGSDTLRMALSDNPEFTNAVQTQYLATTTWMLPEGNGTKTIYAKFFTKYGQASAAVSDSIVYNQEKVTDPELQYIFNKNLYLGIVDKDVIQLKLILAAEDCISGVSNTTYFGPLTLKAVQCFQNKYKAEISNLSGYTISATGYFGPGTRGWVNGMSK